MVSKYVFGRRCFWQDSWRDRFGRDRFCGSATGSRIQYESPLFQSKSNTWSNGKGLECRICNARRPLTKIRFCDGTYSTHWPNKKYDWQKTIFDDEAYCLLYSYCTRKGGRWSSFGWSIEGEEYCGCGSWCLWKRACFNRRYDETGKLDVASTYR